MTFLTEITTTLPLRLYRNQSAEDIRSHIAAEIGVLTQKVAERPDRITDYALSIERLRGQADVLDRLERAFYDAVHWGVEQGWTMTQVLLAQYDIVIDLALDVPNDAASGRGGDGKRAYGDGRREVLARVAEALRRSPWFPGNEKED